MNSSFFVLTNKIFFFLIIFSLLICIFFLPTLSSISSNPILNNFEIFPSGWIWPIPGYTTITSPFGKRNRPTAGASSFHSGMDIGAPEGTNLYAVCDGKITFTGFLGAGGYTITLSMDNIKITYCHVSPIYIVKEGDMIKQGQLIGNVGPKYVLGVKGNQYKDSNGNPTNGATTGPHLHFGVRIDGEYINPMSYFE